MYAKFGAFARFVTIFVNLDANGLDYNGLDTNSSKTGFYVNFFQVYRYFFCNEINSRSLLLWGFDDCEKKEPSKELNRICMLESCNFVL